MTNTIESLGFGKVIDALGGKKAFSKFLAGLMLESTQQAYEEGSQGSADEYARGKQTIANVFNPAGWSDEAWNNAATGFVGGLGLGVLGAGGGRLLTRRATADNFGEQSAKPSPKLLQPATLWTWCVLCRGKFLTRLLTARTVCVLWALRLLALRMKARLT